MDNALKILYNEHEVIVKAIDIAVNAKELIGRNDEEYEYIISGLVRFFRLYADQYHHHKEEEILFPEMAKRNELMADNIIKEMFINHEDFRELLCAIETDIHTKDYNNAAKKIEQYSEALLNHISVENDELFPAACSLFNEEELENIGFRFADLDRELGETKKEELRKLSESPKTTWVSH